MTMATASTSSPARTHAPPAAAVAAARGFMYASPQFKGIVNASRQQSKSASKIERSVTRSASGDGSSGSPIRIRNRPCGLSKRSQIVPHSTSNCPLCFSPGFLLLLPFGCLPLLPGEQSYFACYIYRVQWIDISWLLAWCTVV